MEKTQKLTKNCNIHFSILTFFEKLSCKYNNILFIKKIVKIVKSQNSPILGYDNGGN